MMGRHDAAAVIRLGEKLRSLAQMRAAFRPRRAKGRRSFTRLPAGGYRRSILAPSARS